MTRRRRFLTAAPIALAIAAISIFTLALPTTMAAAQQEKLPIQAIQNDTGQVLTACAKGVEVGGPCGHITAAADKGMIGEFDVMKAKFDTTRAAMTITAHNYTAIDGVTTPAKMTAKVGIGYDNYKVMAFAVTDIWEIKAAGGMLAASEITGTEVLQI